MMKRSKYEKETIIMRREVAREYVKHHGFQSVEAERKPA